MPFKFQDAAGPVFVRGLTSLSSFIDKAQASGIAEQELLDARLAPDMHPFAKQVQMASDGSKGPMARLAGEEPPPMPDTETSLAELKARVQKTLDYIQGVEAAKLDGAEDREIVLKFPQGEMRFPGGFYLTGFAIPNFYFHVTTAYALLRHKGVVLGKMDFLGGPPR